MQFEVPAVIAAAVRDPAEPATPPRDAATVVLLRDGAEGLEVYLLRRVQGMAAFGGMTVFPGGGVDPADVGDQALPWSGPSPEEWTGVLSAGSALARGLVCAAVRETFEESGVLLAGPSADEVVSDTSAPEWEAARQALETHEASLSGVLTEAGLVLRADLLRSWAHWITPASEHRRFDTRFFLAALPAGQHTRDVAGEAENTAWVRPAVALEELARGERVMVPPTALTLADLAGCDDVAAAFALPRRVEPILPELVRRDGALEFVMPGDPGYGHASS